MSDSTLSKLLRDLGINAVPHGFRSSFRDWCGESGQPRELAEAALAHTIWDKAEAAYARTDLLERRGELMEACDWQAGPTPDLVWVFDRDRRRTLDCGRMTADGG